MAALERVVERTANQLAQLTTVVADLTTAVRVGDTQRSDLERRVTNLEQGGSVGRMALVTALVSCVTSITSSVMLHFILGGR